MRRTLLRTLIRQEAGSFPHSIHPSTFRSKPQSLGINTLSRQSQRQPFFHLATSPRFPISLKPATSLQPIFRVNHTSRIGSVNMPKRKSTHVEPEPEVEQATRRRSSRLSKGVEPKEEVEAPVKEEKPKAAAGKKGGRRAAVAKEEEKDEKKEKVQEPPTKRPRTTTSSTSSPSTTTGTKRQYWLLKAEPLTRLENGHDVRFSIDDLASRSAPEPWDGIRNYSARNNLRSMRAGDLAFFYHSNCPNPGIVGVMEIVKEAEEDWTAIDPKAAYFDPKAKKAVEEGKGNPWSLVHVEFREKFERVLGLKELREWGQEKGGALEGMQLLRMGRLSVSKVSKGEWEFLMEKAGGKTGRDGK